ncbi:uncharacterized protein V2V93DRAFT_376508 [Kockiozyma suomiensis]|uniref:uncharacterized protein n=1 Tax=Kockiozyma suomiensis TaxID=1337062 RepID=UPI0033437E07
MPWRILLQQFLHQKLMQSEGFHKVVRAIHRAINNPTQVSDELRVSANNNEKLDKAMSFGRIVLEEIKDAAKGKTPPKS